MGISIALMGGVVSLVLISILGALQGTFTDGTYEKTSTTLEAKKVSDKINRLEMQIESIEAAAGNDLLNFSLVNDGAGKFWNFENFDVIIEYDADIGGVQTRTVEKLVYDSSTSFLGSGSPPTCNTNGFFGDRDWIIASISSDIMDPRIINNEESAQVCTNLSNDIFAGGDATIIVTTDLGFDKSNSITVS